ncbi:hypothetical protein KVT40_003663 [Elsinoe batatas]|uniref:OTU domain-containing protein n=1 Tax=Elsinoe batatas TaxID=2601811 RepID=A0A8K0L5E7_9PEZI|nr:hypothetical protein KVT40_003663 [Elsinoe batatas]
MRGYEDEFPVLSDLGLYAAKTTGDGNCLFYALSDQLYGSEDRGAEIRARVIDFLRNHADEYKVFLVVNAGGGSRRNPKRKTTAPAHAQIPEAPSAEDVNRTWEEHLTQMAKGGTYGDNMEIQAFAAAYNTDVHVYQREHKYVVPAVHGQVAPRAAHVAYHQSWLHYSSIRNIGGPETGLPNVQPKALTPEEQENQRIKMAAAPLVQPWQIKALLNSLPFLIDNALAKRTLEETKGDLNAACSKLLDADDGGSASSAQESSSIEREPDSDDELLHAPNKRQDRRMSRTSRQKTLPSFDHNRLTPFAPASDSGSQESVDSFQSDTPSSTASRTDSQELPSIPSDTINVATDPDTSPAKRPLRIKINPPKPPTSINNRSRQRQTGPRRVSARDKKDMKKLAQKAARKERQLAAGGNISRKMRTGMELRSQGMTETPPIESGFRTLFI